MPFKKGESGNPHGKPKGAKNEKTKQWEALGESICSSQAEQFNSFLNELWSGNIEKKMAASDLYLKTLEYFKPKLSRVESKNENENKHIVEFSEDVKNLAGLSPSKAKGDPKKS